MGRAGGRADREVWARSVASGTPKPGWDDLPPAVRARVAAHVGGVDAVDEPQAGGFTPSVAARIRSSSGSSVFLKAADGERFPQAAAMHRTEGEVVAALDAVPQVPRLLAAFEQDGWVVLLLAHVDGRHPRIPWHEDDLGLVLDGLAELSANLTPSPLPAATPIGDRLDDAFRGWRLLQADGTARARLDHPWAERHLDRLARTESGWTRAAAGTTLLHADLRADQLLLSEDGRLTVVDWPFACVGAAWADPLFMFPSVELQGGPDVEALIGRYPLTANAPRGDLLTLAVALAGYFAHRATLPPPPGLPTVRSFQRAQAEVLLDWLAEALDADRR